MEKSDLETYQAQLSQVELALSSDPDNAELSSLHAELTELIELTRTSLLQAAGSSSSLPNNKTDSSSSSSRNNRASAAAAAAAAASWAAGNECLAKYSGDGCWYPARITSLGGSADNRVYSIVFKGYNTTELVKASEIKPLPANYANHAAGTLSSGLSSSASASFSKRKLSKAEEEEREKKKKKNEKKVEAKAAKAKEQNEKQATWHKFTKKSEKKGVHIAGVAGTSIFKTPDNPLGRVGVTGSGKGMTEVTIQGKHKFPGGGDGK